MGGLSEAELASLRTTVNQFLPETATIARTGLSAKCRVASDKREWHLEGLPHFLPQHGWKITFEDGTDVQVFDSVAVVGMGTFLIMLTTEPHSYSTSTRTYAVYAGSAVTCSTKRGGGALSYGSTGAAYSAHLTSLICRAPGYPASVAPTRDILRPISAESAQDTFGVSAVSRMSVHADWTNPFNENWPVAPKDILVMPDGEELTIDGVKLYTTPGMIYMLVSLPTPKGS